LAITNPPCSAVTLR